MRPEQAPWNHNIHYHPLVLGAVPAGCQRGLPADVAGVVAQRVLLLGKNYQEVNAPTIRPPPQTYAQVRRTASGTLPGVRYRRHLLWRYSLIWVKPPASPS